MKQANIMKVAVIGTGKTGGRVVDLLDDDNVVGPFNKENPPTVQKLQEADVCIIFVPGSSVDDIIETVLDSHVPAVWGSTGYEWPDDDLDERLKADSNKWLRASNFSLGMQVVRRCIQIISKGAESLTEPAFSIHEVHHTGKKDAPSGTALSWREWLEKEAEITSERKGDINGIHKLTMETPFESITIKHEAKSRAVFAKGAIWAARKLINEDLDAGLYTLELLVMRYFERKLVD